MSYDDLMEAHRSTTFDPERTLGLGDCWSPLAILTSWLRRDAGTPRNDSNGARRTKD